MARSITALARDLFDSVRHATCWSRKKSVYYDMQPRASGKIADFGLEALLLQLADLQFTGQMVFTPKSCELFFASGDLIAARGSEMLGSILLRRGAVTAEQLTQAIANQGGKSLGDALLDAPFSIHLAMLRDAIHNQEPRSKPRGMKSLVMSASLIRKSCSHPVETRQASGNVSLSDSNHAGYPRPV